MRLSNLLYFWILLLLLNFHEIQAFIQHAYEIKDLYETDLALFQKEAQHWAIFDESSETKVSEIHVSGRKTPELLLGGPNIVGQDSHIVFQRIYTGLPRHKRVTVFGKFWYFGDFSNEKEWDIFITSDSEPRSLLKAVSTSILEPLDKKINISEGEMKYDYIHTKAPHEWKTLVLIIMLRTRNSEQRSIGFRELIIHLDTGPNYEGNEKPGCHRSEGPTLFKNKGCPCPLNQTLDGYSICRDCLSNCATCYGDPKQGKCFSCSAGASWNGKYCSTCHWSCKECTGPSQNECSVCHEGFQPYDNGTCFRTCYLPFERAYEGAEWKCIRPSCKADQYLMECEDCINNCVNECPSPLFKFTNEDNTKVCLNPCSDDSHFLYWNGSCLACPQPLKQVDGLYGPQCQNPCETTSQYLYANNSCLDNCPAPYQAVSDPGVNFCKHPCRNPQFYVDNNGACHPVCRLPFRVKVESDIKYCLPPCDFEKEFILSDGSCSDECPAPMRTKLKAPVGTYCLSPCESDDHFVTDSGECLLNCPSFFDVKMKYGVKHCLQPCLADQYYLEQNKSCLSTCPSPFIQVQSDGVSVCKNPCLNSEKDFIYDDQSCHESCPTPLRIKEENEGIRGKYCKSPCDWQNRYLNVDGMCQMKCEYPYKVVEKGPYKICLIDMTISQVHQIEMMRDIVKVSKKISEVGGFLSCLINAGDPTSLFMIPLLNMLEIIKYTEITLPGEIQLSFNQEHRILKSSNQQIFEDLQEIFDEKIGKIAVICLVAFLLSGVLRMITPISNGSRVVKLLQRCSIALQWNILASVFISFLGDMTLYSLVAFRHSGIQFRILISLLVILPLIVFIMSKIIRVNSEEKSIELIESQEELQRWRFVFEIYKSDRLSQRLFVLIFMMRVASVSVIIGCLERYPVVQAILLVIVSFGMLLYLVCASPIQKKLCFVQHMVIESTMLLYNVLVAILAMKDDAQNLDADVKNALGQLMGVFYLITPLLTAILIVMKFLYHVYSLNKREGSSSNIRSSLDFIQLSEASHNGDIDEEIEEPPRIEAMDGDNNHHNDFEDDTIEPTDISV